MEMESCRRTLRTDVSIHLFTKTACSATWSSKSPSSILWNIVMVTAMVVVVVEGAGHWKASFNAK
jgi:hypothetical protein